MVEGLDAVVAKGVARQGEHRYAVLHPRPHRRLKDGAVGAAALLGSIEGNVRLLHQVGDMAAPARIKARAHPAAAVDELAFEFEGI